MKRIFFAASAILLFFAGCTKVSSSLDEQDIKLEFTVAERPDFGVQTKAVKTGWAEFDEIRIILSVDEVGNDYLTDQYGDNSVSIMRYNGKWKEGNIKNIHVSSTGYYNAIHHNGSVDLSDANSWGASLSKYKGGEYLTAKGTYQYSDGVLKLSPIVMERPEDMIQISVKDLSKETGDWTLTVTGTFAGNELTGLQHLSAGSIGLDSQGNVTNESYSTINAQGVKCGDDLAFCFRAGTNPGTKVYTFTLSNGVQGYTYQTTTNIKQGNAYLLPSLESNSWAANILK